MYFDGRVAGAFQGLHRAPVADNTDLTHRLRTTSAPVVCVDLSCAVDCYLQKNVLFAAMFLIFERERETFVFLTELFISVHNNV